MMGLAKSETQYYATGRRKTATARAFLRSKKATGKFTINGRTVHDYFGPETLRMLVHLPLIEAGIPEDRFDMVVTVKGGGGSGQAGAVCHAISRALVKYDESLRKVLRARGLLTRDSRMKERKKVGKPSARASKQFSKR
jgi:small subunit ribosomal protein S9